MPIVTGLEPIATLLDSIRKNSAVNGTFRCGIDLAVKRGMKQRCYVIEYHGNNRATFECSAAGHQFKQQMFRKAPNGKLPAEALIVKFARYWGRHHEGCSGGGTTMECPKCNRLV